MGGGWERLGRRGGLGGCLLRRSDFLFSFCYFICFISFVLGFGGGRSLLFSCLFSFSISTVASFGEII